MKKIILFIIASGCSLYLFGQVPSPRQLDKTTRNIVLNSIGNAINSYYVFPDTAKLMWNYINRQNEKDEYDLLVNPNDFANKVVKDIRSVYDDAHLRIEYNPQLEADILKFLSSKKEAGKVADAAIAKDEKMNFYFRKIEILPSNIGYIQLNGFATSSLSASKTIQAAMQFVAHTDALIIDLRNNYGGNAETADEVAGYFFRNKTYTGESFNRIENKWTQRYVENKKAITGGLVLDMPVYILTSHSTFSAAEGFAYIFQTIKKSMIIGDTTRGGAHLTRSFSLGNGFVGFIPFTRGKNAVTNTDWEGTGVIPDISTADSDCLITAHNIILNKKLAATKGETEKRKISYLLNYNRSKNASAIINPLNASKLTGQFAEFEVTLQGDQLMFRDTNERTVKYKKMSAVTPTLFQVGNDYQVEFILENGLCTSIKMYWDDGWEESMKRVR
jgi:C-terminal processing protease CtpA/Prc